VIDATNITSKSEERQTVQNCNADARVHQQFYKVTYCHDFAGQTIVLAHHVTRSITAASGWEIIRHSASIGQGQRFTFLVWQRQTNACYFSNRCSYFWSL
jgi:hypothetical protein